MQEKLPGSAYTNLAFFRIEVFRAVRTMMINGVPRFAATDITGILGYHKDPVKKLCCKEKYKFTEEDKDGNTFFSNFKDFLKTPML